MAISTIEAPSTAAPEILTVHTVTSKDSTPIGYRQIGSGPGLILMHGAMESSLGHVELAQALADTFTCYLPDRRGRGLSGSYGNDYSLQKDIEDVDALLSATGARYVFGVSSGAIMMLEAARQLPAIRKAAIFEPPIVIDNSLDLSFLKKYEKELEEGDTISALVTAMLGAQMGPPMFQSFPRGVLKWMTKKMVEQEDKKAKPGDVTMRMLAPTLRYEFQFASRAAQMLPTFRDIKAQLLLMRGTKSPAYLRTAVGALAKVRPDAKLVELEGMHHGASGNRNRGGQPKKFAQVLREFFS